MENEKIEIMECGRIYDACSEGGVDHFARDIMTAKIPTGSTLANDFYPKRVAEIWDGNEKLRAEVFAMLDNFRSAFAKGTAAFNKISPVIVAGYYNSTENSYKTATLKVETEKIDEYSSCTYPALIFEYDELQIKDGKPAERYRISRIECIVEDYEQADDLYGAFEVV